MFVRTGCQAAPLCAENTYISEQTGLHAQPVNIFHVNPGLAADHHDGELFLVCVKRMSHALVGLVDVRSSGFDAQPAGLHRQECFEPRIVCGCSTVVRTRVRLLATSPAHH
jgi:hypothetical protein